MFPAIDGGFWHNEYKLVYLRLPVGMFVRACVRACARACVFVCVRLFQCMVQSWVAAVDNLYICFYNYDYT